MTFCLSSFDFMRTMDRLAEVSEAKMTKSWPVIPNDTTNVEGGELEDGSESSCVYRTDLPW